MKDKRSWVSVALCAAVLGTMLAPIGASAAVECAGPTSGGDWSSFGGDLWNTRHQTAEDTISTANAYSLTPAFAYALNSTGAVGGFQSAAVVVDGCLFLGTNTGWLVKLNADTGELVWQTKADAGGLIGTLSGGIFTVGVDDDHVYANVSTTGKPATVAMDRETGSPVWATVVDESPGAYTNSSVTLIEDMVWIGISGPENTPEDERHPGGFALLDRETGDIITRQYLVTEEEDARGYKGTSMWATPVYDEETGYMYNGTAQPASKHREHRYSNALVKVDVAKARDDAGSPVPSEEVSNPNFGKVVAHYHGNWDEGLDIDYGASPSMWTDSDGNKIVGTVQKSGVFAAAFADDMGQAWWARLADPFVLGSASDPAVDEDGVYVGASFSTNHRNASVGTDNRDPELHGGAIYALDRDTGDIKWRTPVSGVIDFHPMAVANGVVYTVTNHGVLLGIDTETGIPVLVRSMALDTADACVNLSGGATIARNKLYAPCDTGVQGGGWFVAYELMDGAPELPL